MQIVNFFIDITCEIWKHLFYISSISSFILRKTRKLLYLFFSSYILSKVSRNIGSCIQLSTFAICRCRNHVEICSRWKRVDGNGEKNRLRFQSGNLWRAPGAQRHPRNRFIVANVAKAKSHEEWWNCLMQYTLRSHKPGSPSVRVGGTNCARCLLTIIYIHIPSCIACVTRN